MSRVSADMGTPEQTIYAWLKKTDQGGRRQPAEGHELAAENKRIRELETENEVLRRASAYLSLANLSERIYPLVDDLVASGIAVSTALTVLGSGRSELRDRKIQPVSDRDWAGSHP